MIDLLVFVFGSVSLMCNVLLVLFHLCWPGLWRASGSCLFMINIFYILNDLHWVTIYSPLQQHISSAPTCYILGIVFTFVYFQLVNCISLVSLHILSKVFQWRLKKYKYSIARAISAGLSGVETVGVYLLDGFGISVFDTCFIEGHSTAELLLGLPLILNLPIGFATLGITQWKANKRDSLNPTIRVLALLLITWGVSTGFLFAWYFYNRPEPGLYYIELFNSLSGLLFVIVRIFNSYTLVQLKLIKQKEQIFYFKSISSLLINKSTETCCMQETLENSEIMDSDGSCEDPNKTVLLEILILLNLRYSDSDDSRSSVHDFHERIHSYEQYMYKELSLKYNIPYFNQCIVYIGNYSKLYLSEYNYEIFAGIRQAYRWYNQDLLRIFIKRDNFLSIENTEALDISLPYLTSDKKIIIQVLSPKQANLFKRLLMDYYNRITSTHESKLLHILGFYMIKPHNKYFVIMENVYDDGNVSKIYEISPKIAKEVYIVDCKPGPVKEILKENFPKVCVGGQGTLGIIKEDLKLLEKYKIINYEIILILYNNKSHTATYGIIDIDGSFYKLAIVNFFTEGNIINLIKQNKNAKNYKRATLKVLSNIISIN